MTDHRTTNEPRRGFVTKAHSGFFSVVSEPDSRTYICQAAGRLTKGKHVEDAVAVGDWVMFELVPSEGYVDGRIVSVEPRSRVLARKDPIIGTGKSSCSRHPPPHLTRPARGLSGLSLVTCLRRIRHE